MSEINTQNPVYKTISPAQAKSKIEDDANAIFVDVRTRQEYAEGHIPGSKLIPYDQISYRAESELPDKNAIIIVYCYSGSRSSMAARKLISLGYTGVFDMGGIYAWPYGVQAGLPG